MAVLSELVAHLDAYLRLDEVPDNPQALNGLQVENAGSIGWIVAAVDASQRTIDGVVAALGTRGAQGSPLVLVHHGLFWDGNQPVTGRRYRRLHTLMEHDIALYSAHIPLDLHPEVGNNALLARALGLASPEPFGMYQGVLLGVAGELAVAREELVGRVAVALAGEGGMGKGGGSAIRSIPGGPERTRRVGVVTGAGGSMIREARDAGCDTLVTGEGAHHTYFDAMELGVNVLYAGHYATEQLGVKALAAHLADRFGVLWEFHDHPTGL